MNTNFSRPSLGISQEALFSASNEMAQNNSLRFEFMSQPQSFLNKRNVSISEGTFDVSLKTSEIIICKPVVWCVAVYWLAIAGGFGFFLGGAAAVGGLAGGVAYAYGNCWHEFSGCSIENPMHVERFKGIC